MDKLSEKCDATRPVRLRHLVVWLCCLASTATQCIEAVQSILSIHLRQLDFQPVRKLTTRVQTCLRCQQSHRPCGGYTTHPLKKFRNYDSQHQYMQKPQSIARKCSLPRCTGPEETLPTEVSAEEAELFALGCFVYDYCIASESVKQSRGFLGGVEPVLHRVGMRSDLAKACEAVALATHATPLGRPSHIRKAKSLHTQVLSRFARDMAKPSMASSSEALTTSMLLGLYEVRRTLNL